MKKNTSIHNMIGRPWLYKGQEHFIQNYHKKDGVHFVVTDQKWFEFDSDEGLAFFLDNCLPVEEKKPGTAIAALAPADEYGLAKPNSGSGNIMAYLKGILVEDIERVREDREYVEQAKTVSNNVKRLIDIARLELSIHKFNRE